MNTKLPPLPVFSTETGLGRAVYGYAESAPGPAARMAWEYWVQEAYKTMQAYALSYGELVRAECLPAGWVAVPKEPTKEMVWAACKAESRHRLEDSRRGGKDPDLGFQGVYSAMISAAPTPPLGNPVQAEPQKTLTQDQIDELMRKAVTDAVYQRAAAPPAQEPQPTPRGCRSGSPSGGDPAFLCPEHYCHVLGSCMRGDPANSTEQPTAQAEPDEYGAPLFGEMIAQHEGLAEELAAQDPQPVPDAPAEVAQFLKSQAGPKPEKWVFDPHDTEQGYVINPEWLSYHGVTTKDLILGFGPKPVQKVLQTEGYKGVETLPERDAKLTDTAQGVFRKFEVRRVDGSDQPGSKHYGCEHFVLDVTHDPCAKAALAAYADAVEATHPVLAADMRSRYTRAAHPQPPSAPADAQPPTQQASRIAFERAIEALDELEAAARGDEPFPHFAGPLIRQTLAAHVQDPCDVPPSSWYCTREKGHDGPCAAHPAPQQADAQPSPAAKPRPYHPNEKAVREACEILTRVRDATELWKDFAGGWSGTSHNCEAAINLLRDGSFAPVNQADHAAAPTSGEQG